MSTTDWTVTKYQGGTDPNPLSSDRLLATVLADLAAVMNALPASELDPTAQAIRDECSHLSDEVKAAIAVHGVVEHKGIGGTVYAYETDGYGSTYLMDDANIPSLLSCVLWKGSSDPS